VFVLVLAAEADETRQTMTMLIGSLVGIAVLLALLTVWYWFHTDPKRRSRDNRVADGDGDVAVADPAPDRPAPDPVAAGIVSTPAPPPLSVPPAPAEDAEAEDAEPEPERVVSEGAAPECAEPEDAEPAVAGPVLASQTWDFVAAARRAEEEGLHILQPTRPAVPRIRVSGRSGADGEDDDGDELAVARRRREREAARGLSDEAWESVRRSVFNKLES
jgi:hypothetical protein